MTTASALVLLLAALSTGVVSTIIVALLLKAVGVGVPEVGLGVGAPRARINFGHTRVTVTPWIFSCWSTVKEPWNLELYPDTPGKTFDHVHPLLRALILVTGPLAVAALAVPILGITAIDSMWLGFRQLIEGAASPTIEGQRLLSGFAAVADSSLLIASATLMTKCAAFMLLPLPSLPGGNALVQLLRWQRPHYPRSTGGLTIIGLLLVVALVSGWAFALIRFSFS